MVETGTEDSENIRPDHVRCKWHTYVVREKEDTEFRVKRGMNYLWSKKK